MATRSTIAVQHSNGKVSRVYSHWDGYVAHNGRMLVDYYPTLELAEELVSYGNISYLGSAINPTENHNFEHPQKGVTVYYGRDRGEEYTEPYVYDDLEMYRLQNAYEEFNYIFKDGEWYLNNGKAYKLVKDHPDYKKS